MSQPTRYAAIIKHIQEAAFINPIMIKMQWGLDYKVAKALYDSHYNKSRAC